MAAAAGADAQALLTNQSAIGGVAGAIAGPGAEAGGALAGGVAAAAGGGNEMLDISQVEGRVQASSLKKIGDIIEKHPEEAVSIIRSWMYQDQS